MNRARALRDVPDLARTAFYMELRYGDSFHYYLVLFRQCAGYHTGLTFVFAGDYFDFVSFFYVHMRMN